MKRKYIRYCAFAGYVLALVVLSYGSTVAYRGLRMYRYIKAKNTILTPGVSAAHPELGYAPIPGSSGRMLYLAPPDVRVTYDGERCRIEDDGLEPHCTTEFLFLGCSFTHGDACPFAETYPPRVARRFGALPRNRGFCAYGLTQMVLVARTAVPTMRPAYVFAQYSPWVVSRALRAFAPTSVARRPQPFFFVGDDGVLSIHPPPYLSGVVQTPAPAAQYRDTPSGLADMASFGLRCALPLCFDQDVNQAGYFLRRALGVIPAAARDRSAVIACGYGEIQRLCQQYGARLLVPIIGSPGDEPPEQDLEVLRRLGVDLVDCWSPLLARLPAQDRATFMASYAHFRGSPPRMIDAHPNATAHGIIAETLIRRLEPELSAGVPNTDGPDQRLDRVSEKIPVDGRPDGAVHQCD